MIGTAKASGMSLFALLTASAAQAACPAGAIQVMPGANLSEIVSRAAQGASFCLRAGEYRMQSVRPKKNQKFYGQGTAILNGSRLITAFSRDGSFWVASNQTQEGFRHKGEHCLENRPRCDRPEAFYINNRPLLAVASKAQVAEGKFFFDYDANKIYFLDDPTGKKVEASVSPYAFHGVVSGVLIQGLTIEKYSSPIQYGAIGYNAPGEGWVLRNNTVRLNYGVGVRAESSSRLLNNFIHDNGELGIGCDGDNVLIQGNEIARNGFFAGLDPSGKAEAASAQRPTASSSATIIPTITTLWDSGRTSTTSTRFTKATASNTTCMAVFRTRSATRRRSVTIPS